MNMKADDKLNKMAIRVAKCYLSDNAAYGDDPIINQLIKDHPQAVELLITDAIVYASVLEECIDTVQQS